MKIMTRDSVETHSDRYGPSHPAVNVKVYHYPTTDQVMDRFHCSEESAERALRFAFEVAQEMFWNETTSDIAQSIFGPCVKIYSEGRSAGWLVVHGLDELESWNGRDLLRWTRFERAIKREVAWLSSWEWVEDMINANEWAPVDLAALQADASEEA